MPALNGLGIKYVYDCILKNVHKADSYDPNYGFAQQTIYNYEQTYSMYNINILGA